MYGFNIQFYCFNLCHLSPELGLRNVWVALRNNPVGQIRTQCHNQLLVPTTKEELVWDPLKAYSLIFFSVNWTILFQYVVGNKGSSKKGNKKKFFFGHCLFSLKMHIFYLFVLGWRCIMTNKFFWYCLTNMLIHSWKLRQLGRY